MNKEELTNLINNNIRLSKQLASDYEGCMEYKRLLPAFRMNKFDELSKEQLIVILENTFQTLEIILYECTEEESE